VKALACRWLLATVIDQRESEVDAQAVAWDAVPRHRAYVGLGGNLGDVQAHFRSALRGLNGCAATCVEAVSSLYRTRPVDSPGPDYLNAVAAIQSALGPHELLRALQQLEWAHDRERPYRNAPRTLDLDLLSYGGLVLADPVLTLPHPRMMVRAFVLTPLAELMAFFGDDGRQSGLRLPDLATQVALAKSQGIERLGPAPDWRIG